jgi:hypothetical protein
MGEASFMGGAYAIGRRRATLAADTLAADTLAADTLAADTLRRTPRALVPALSRDKVWNGLQFREPRNPVDTPPPFFYLATVGEG